MFPRGARFPPAKGVIDCAQISVVFRLTAVAVSDVPGPNSYNANPGPSLRPSVVAYHTQCPISDSQLDSYKHGAFLEKADRFTETKPSDVPGKPQRSFRPPYLIFTDALEGPGSYPQSNDHGTVSKQPAKRVVSATGERYTALRRQLEELEHMYAESRKTVRASFKSCYTSTF